MTSKIQNIASEPLVEISPPDPTSIAKQLFEIQSSSANLGEKRNSILQIAVGLVNAAGVIYFEQENDILKAHGKFISRQAASWSEDIELECRSHAESALDQEKGVVNRLKNVPEVRFISCPVAEQNSCLCALVFLGDNPAEPFLIILQLLATVLAQINAGGNSIAQKGNLTRGLLEFFAQKRSSYNHRQFVDLLRHGTGCSLAAVGTQNVRKTITLQSITDVVKADSRTEQSRLYLKVIEECLRKKQTLLWPGSDDHVNDAASLVLKELLRDTKMAAGAAIYLQGTETTGTVLVLLWKDEKAQSGVEELSHLANVLGPVVYTLFTKHSQKNGDASAPSHFKKLTLVLIGAALLLGVASVPISYKLRPECWVEPLNVRFVVARFDGLLEDIYVEPGQHVETSEDLATLDGREIKLELSSLEADIGKASKVHDSHMAMGEVALAQMAMLERQRLVERQTLLTKRLKELQVESPVEGIVLSSDLRKQKGGPVSRGQVLFEIAPLETVVLELGIADENVSFLHEGLPVKVNFEAYPNRLWTGKIERIAPKSELRQGENKFIASFDLNNSEGLLQPGMHGQAVVTAERKSLAWVYFHKPWYALRRALFSFF